MLRYLIFPLVILVLIAIYNIIKQIPEALRISREKKRREAEHREYMAAYNTRRQLYSEVYSVSRRFNLSGNEDAQTQNVLSYCNEDDEVGIEFDHSRKKYAASCNGGRIGYLPPGADNALSTIKDYKAIITAIGFTNTDKYYVKVTVYSDE